MSSAPMELLNHAGKEAMMLALQADIPALAGYSFADFEKIFINAFNQGVKDCRAELTMLEAVYDDNNQLYAGEKQEVPYNASIFLGPIEEILDIKWGTGNVFSTTEIRCLRRDIIVPVNLLKFKEAFTHTLELVAANTAPEAKAIAKICGLVLKYKRFGVKLDSWLNDEYTGAEDVGDLLGSGFSNRRLHDFLVAVAAEDQLSKEGGYLNCEDSHLGAYQVAFSILRLGGLYESHMG